MRRISILIFFLAFTVIPFAQEDIENLVYADFTIRDVLVDNYSLFYIKKRNLHTLDNELKPINNRFIGGYGLRVLKDENVIITVSNELVDNVSSVRFFEKNKNHPSHVYYNYGGKILDAIVVPEKDFFVLSLISNKIIFIDYSQRPKFVKFIEIKLNSQSRKITHDGNKLFFATDSGEIYRYEIDSYEKLLVYKDSEVITDLVINEDKVFYTTLGGKVKRLESLTNNVIELKISDTFVSTIFDFKNRLICGNWNGEVIIVNKELMKIESQKKVHKRSILKIIKLNSEFFCSTGVDGIIKKWRFYSKNDL
ncbi:MAG: hypothetical protein GY932_09000 [Arcobacter sp.]|nr:hypothetical protein [Arcobacter sp.]